VKVRPDDRSFFLGEEIFLGDFLHPETRMFFADDGHKNEMPDSNLDRGVDDIRVSRIAIGERMGRDQHHLLDIPKGARERIRVKIVTLAQRNSEFG